MSTRREFFALVGAGAVASATTMRAGKPDTAVGCPAERTCIGVATVDSHGGRLKRVWLNGEDVTRDCFYANDDSGRFIGEASSPFGGVKVYKRNAKKHFYVWGLGGDPDPATRREGWEMRHHKVDGKWAVNKPYPGFGDVAYDEFIGDVRIVVL